MSASLVASVTKDEASPPDPWMSATTALKEADVRPAATTCSPSLAKRLQSCAPSPRSGPTPMSPLSAWKSSRACRPEPCDDGRSG